MKCLETEDCWCAACVDRIFNKPEEPKPIRHSSVPFVDVSTILEYGLEQKLSQAIRCF
jgi:hypothetical protein